jgi:FKBP-type peptidyl-prolyl cis-trans isomerase
VHLKFSHSSASLSLAFAAFFGFFLAAQGLFAQSTQSAQPNAEAVQGETPVPVDVATPPRNATRTVSGSFVKVITRGAGTAHPGMNDCVKLQYTTWSRDGSVVARSEPSSTPGTQCMGTLSPDVAAAVRKMVLGTYLRLWVPARTTGKGDAGKQTAPLTYDLLLVQIIKAPELPRDLKSPPTAARKLASGVTVQLLSGKTSGTEPVATSRVELRLAGWTASGKLFESTGTDRPPAQYAIRELIPGLREGVQQLSVGERARVWIPASLAYGKKPRRGQPAGDLVYDVELVSADAGN